MRKGWGINGKTPEEIKATNAWWEREKQKLKRQEHQWRHEQFFSSDKWLKVRYATLARFAGVCLCCGCRPTPGNPIQVDHIKPRSKYPDLELDPDNLQILCRHCNVGKGASDETDWRWV